MFALAVEYLMGRSIASLPGAYDEAEWPPHPDRLFMALAAAAFESVSEAEVEEAEADEAEAFEALRWLEGLPPPAVAASEHEARSSVTTYVPTNDQLAYPKTRAGRSFAAAIPHSPVVHFLWPEVECPPGTRVALQQLCDRATYLGHSSSPVRVWIDDAPPPATHVPTAAPRSFFLRVPDAGRLADLAASYERRERPKPRKWQGYSPHSASEAGAPPAAQGAFDSRLIVFRRLDGSALDAPAVLTLTTALRGAAMSLCDQQPVPEWLSGHRVDGSPSADPHVAFLALPDVGHEHADGHLMGLALALPRRLDPRTLANGLRRLLADELGRPIAATLKLGACGVWTIERETREAPPVALRGSVWTRASRRWASVTPVVLDRHPKGDDDVESQLAEACERTGLPRPRDVILTPVSPHVGAPHAKQFPPLPSRYGKSRRSQWHVIVTFEETVLGPVLLGAGRFRGYGLFRPLVSPGEGGRP